MQFNIDTSIPIIFEQVEEVNEDSRFYRVKVWMAHTNTNKNRSSFSEELLTSMSTESLAGIPICGYIQVKDDNTLDFKAHEERIVIERDSIKIEYIGRAYGHIPMDHNARFENKMTPTGEKQFLVCDGLLWTKFANCIEIFENNEGTMHQSMELDRSSIEGFVDKNGIFNFTKAKFDCACILSNDIKTGMDGALIEKFSLNSIQSQFKEMLQEYAQFSSNQLPIEGGENVKNENVINEGDVKMELLEQKNSLFAKFTNLVDEDVQEIKSRLDQFSLEDLELKLKELSDAKFALTFNQLESEIRKVLSSKKIIVEYWGDSYEENEFYMRDIKDNLVIVMHNNYVDYFGIPFTQNGDLVDLNFDGKVPYLLDWRPKVEGATLVKYSASDEISERVKVYIEKAGNKVKDAFSVIESDEYKQLEKDFSELKTTSETVLQNFTLLNTEYEAVKNQNVEFSEWKTNKERSEKESAINSDTFKLFSEEEKKVFIDSIDKYSLDELKNKMFLELGKKVSQNQFSFNEKRKEVSINFENAHSNEEVKSEKPYADLIREKNIKK